MNGKTALLWIIALLYVSNVYGSPGYLMIISDGQKIDNYIYEFDILLKSSGENFELTSYQAVFGFDTRIVSGGLLNFIYVDGTSDLNNYPSMGIGVNTSDGKAKLTFASTPGSETITGQAKKVGRFRLQSSNSFDINPSINWNFQGKITTIITGSSFADITNPSNHISNIAGLSQLEVSDVIASGIPDQGTSPEKTIDGLGYYDADPLSRWAVKPMPQWISYDLGSELVVSTVKISFFSFHLNRIYQYSIAVSDDSTNWNEIISNANSIAEEWTIAEFTPVNARYVKVVLLSSTDNPNNWANIWETEIWGTEQIVPVELINFTANVTNNNVKLIWSTASETNNKGFEVERQVGSRELGVGSRESGVWSREYGVGSGLNRQLEIADKWSFVSFVEGNGNATERSEYSYLIENETPGKYLYRLKQIDFNGEFSFSPIVTVEITAPRDFVLYQNYPNPFNPQTTIRFEIKEQNFVNLSVYNILGEKIKDLVNNVLDMGYHEIKFDGSEFAGGIYICRFDIKDKYTDIKKMVLLK